MLPTTAGRKHGLWRDIASADQTRWPGCVFEKVALKLRPLHEPQAEPYDAPPTHEPHRELPPPHPGTTAIELKGCLVSAAICRSAPVLGRSRLGHAATAGM